MQRTTIRLEDRLMARVKEYAARERRTLTGVIDYALRRLLSSNHSGNRAQKRPQVRLPISKAKSGFASGIKTWADVKRVLEEEEIEKFKRIARENAAARR